MPLVAKGCPLFRLSLRIGLVSSCFHLAVLTAAGNQVERCDPELTKRNAVYLVGGYAENILAKLDPPRGDALFRLLPPGQVKSSDAEPHEQQIQRELARDLYNAAKKLPSSSASKASSKCLYELVLFLYQSLGHDNLDELARLVRGSVSLRVAVLSEIPSRHPLSCYRFMEEAFDEFGATLKARSQLQQLEKSGSDRGKQTYLRRAYGLSDKNLDRVKELLQDFIRAATVLAMTYPDLGQMLGTWLDPVLTDSIQLFEGHSFQQSLKEAHDWLIEFDAANISGPSHFYAARRLVQQAAHTTLLTKQIETLTESEREDAIKEHLIKGVTLLSDPSRSWIPFNQYSDDLNALYKQSQDDALKFEVQQSLADRSCVALYNGIWSYIQNVPRPDDSELKTARKSLLDRIYTHSNKLQQRGLYQESICFASRFFDDPAILADSDSELIHGQLAIAHYVLGAEKTAMEHLDESGDTMSFGDLKEFKEKWARFLTQTALVECAENRSRLLW